MADNNDSNESYDFPELDGYTPEGYDETQSTPEPDYGQVASTEHSGISISKINPVWRNGLAVIILIALLMLAYKFYGNRFFTQKKEPSKITSIAKKPMPDQAKQIPQQPIIEPPPKIVAPVNQPEGMAAKVLRQKLSRLELSQQSINSNVNEIESKLNGLDGNVTDIANQLSGINQQLNAIADKLDEQATTISAFKARLQPKKKPKPKRIAPPPTEYSLQAIIPGRAWLIGSNGSTITVSKGSQIVSYGVVKMIDAQQGRVITSSGKIIKFEQDNY